ncbi:MAG: hypothetical protein ABFS56_30205 [Pseudomonadota bacterium]
MKKIGKSLLAVLIVSLISVACAVTAKQKVGLERDKLALEREKLALEREKLALEREKLALEKQMQNDDLELVREEENMCVRLYNILNKCHQQGEGKSAESCANLTLRIAEKFAPDFMDNPDSLASFSLMCGKACAYGSEGKTFMPFPIFQREICR